ncbi:hypothetical protein J4440_03080 [Candidatus Woesearchaeota archaeon]|nr:hypothetical protein [Candidatus Woesearchaeota archaeon]
MTRLYTEEQEKNVNTWVRSIMLNKYIPKIIGIDAQRILDIEESLLNNAPSPLGKKLDNHDLEELLRVCDYFENTLLRLCAPFGMGIVTVAGVLSQAEELGYSVSLLDEITSNIIKEDIANSTSYLLYIEERKQEQNQFFEIMKSIGKDTGMKQSNPDFQPIAVLEGYNKKMPLLFETTSMTGNNQIIAYRNGEIKFVTDIVQVYRPKIEALLDT